MTPDFCLPLFFVQISFGAPLFQLCGYNCAMHFVKLVGAIAQRHSMGQEPTTGSKPFRKTTSPALSTVIASIPETLDTLSASPA